jgi:ribonuclease HII
MDMLRYEKEAWNAGLFLVAGVDEAGRGPLAGPVVAAAVAFERDPLEDGGAERFAGLTDSKVLAATRREGFFEQLQSCPFAHIGVAVVGPEVIDEINILQATWKGMAEAVAQITPRPDFALVDGNPVRGLACRARNIIKGDALSLSIAAASVMAKVTRDRLMAELDIAFPLYGFARHKGYGTRAHLAALHKHGPSPHHRKTFRPVANLRQETFPF